ncbi:Bug family tripartite tricarboxylate transporter substrate binding protein [Pseudorhodoferax soli]|uniref:Tripartite-type tricarboxylate transporter receptor subunit TctC n=1 Tax=Pseudorhodoferax soli TaxID=545864 RepID=A0A368XN29_9BURK|nr:tripartite tricarboxylate transporter substrate binding protein [Pseudorhodoferax soli]RCW68576.1 tripartite-type tricarboxylate transporter receptor subunit TctC [Pseudorhodoferax soli]
MKKYVAAFGLALTASIGMAQSNYPAQAVTAVVGYVPGGAADIIMRQLAILMGPKFPSGLVVLNRPGAGGSTAVASIAQGKPDGYTFAFVPHSNLTLSPQVNKLSYKNPDDILPIINVVNYSTLLVVAKNSPYKDAKELLAAAKAAPGTVSVGYPGDTTISHLNVLELERVAKVELLKVPFTGWGQGSPQLLGGHINAAVAQPTEATSFLEAGTVRGLASFSEKRQTGLPSVPTMKEQGADVGIGVRYMLITTKGTPPNIVKYIHDAAKAATETKEFKDFAASHGLELAYQDGNAIREAAWADYRKYGELLKQLAASK